MGVVHVLSRLELPHRLAISAMGRAAVSLGTASELDEGQERGKMGGIVARLVLCL